MTRSKADVGGMVLEDGPCAGRYSARRSPYFLRAVRDTTNGKVDLLDQLDDTPRPTERVHVYEAFPGTISSDLRLALTIVCPPPTGASGRYWYRADVEGEQLRDTDAWRTWARAQPAKEKLRDGDTGELIEAGVGR
jgi:hypothetical protein